MTHENDVETAPPQDPLLAFVPVPYRATFYPYGFPALIESNSALVLKAAEQSWGHCSRLSEEAPITVRFLVVDGVAGKALSAPVFRAQRNLLTIVADAENHASCDLVNGFAFACVSAAAVANVEYFRLCFLEAMTYSLLNTLRHVALHAACVARNGRGVLLAGDSGAGKSSLAYACACRGWTYVSDDASCLLRRGKDNTVMGNSQLFRFRDTVGGLFPEFAGLPHKRRPLQKGKPTIEIRTDCLPGIQTAQSSRVDFVVFLRRSIKRSASSPWFTPVSRESALNQLCPNVWPPELTVNDEHRAAVARLLKVDTLALHYHDLESAVNLLQQLVERR
jgi:hypothetical protein